MSSYTRQYNWQSDRDAGIPIKADRMDQEFDAIVTGTGTIDSEITTINSQISALNSQVGAMPALGQAAWFQLNAATTGLTLSFTKVSATQIKVVGGASLVTITDPLRGSPFEVGRRFVLGTPNNQIGTILSRSTSGSDVTLTVSFDDFSSVPATIPTLYVSQRSAVYPPEVMSTTTRIEAFINANQVLSPNVETTVQFRTDVGPSAYGSSGIDTRGEWNNTTYTYGSRFYGVSPSLNPFTMVLANLHFRVTTAGLQTFIIRGYGNDHPCSYRIGTFALNDEFVMSAMGVYQPTSVPIFHINALASLGATILVNGLNGLSCTNLSMFQFPFRV